MQTPSIRVMTVHMIAKENILSLEICYERLRTLHNSPIDIAFTSKLCSSNSSSRFVKISGTNKLDRLHCIGSKTLPDFKVPCFLLRKRTNWEDSLSHSPRRFRPSHITRTLTGTLNFAGISRLTVYSTLLYPSQNYILTTKSAVL